MTIQSPGVVLAPEIPGSKGSSPDSWPVEYPEKGSAFFNNHLINRITRIVSMDRLTFVLLGAALALLLITAGCTQPASTSTVSPATTQTTAPDKTPATPSATTAPIGMCSANLSYCAGDSSCHDLTLDIGNCGECGAVCPGNTSCIAGRCYCKSGYEVEGTKCIWAPYVEGKSTPVLTSADNGCPEDMTPCSDKFCHFLQTDTDNCGACGNKCPVGLVCDQDTCTSPSSNSGLYIDEEGDYRSVNNYNPSQIPVDKGCPGGLTACPDNICHNLGSDPDNCGLCGNICPEGLVCSGSTCMNAASTIVPTVTPTVFVSGITTPNPVFCPSIGLTFCNNACVDTKTDAENCGACGNTCQSPNTVCCGGKCVNVNADPGNCGSCRQVCTATSSCNTGTCTPKIVPALMNGTALP